MSADVAALRNVLDQRFPDATPITRRTAEPVGTGIHTLDEILPGGGLPRGRLCAWLPRGGATALLRGACLAACAGGERSAWIDGSLTVDGSSWTDGPLLVRPRSRIHALRAAEDLLRSGGFALLVLAGAEPEGTENVRLSRAAREGGGAFVALTGNAATASLRVTTRVHPGGYVWREGPFGEPAQVEAVTVSVRAMSLGWNRATSLVLPVSLHEQCMALQPGFPDRRGGARRLGRSATGRP